jgi:hypothetical protein
MDKLIANWVAAKQAATQAIAFERSLRAQLVGLHSHVGELHSGTENVAVFGGTLKIVHKIDYSVTGDNDAVDAMLDTIEKSQEGGNVIAERLIRWKPELSVTEYKVLRPDQRAIVDKLIETKPASKTIEFKPNVT